LGGNVAVPFLFDVEVHVRYLVALPLLIIAELVVHRRMRPLVQQFLERNLIPESAMTRFDAAIASAFRLRNSVFAEAFLIAIVYGGRHPDYLAPVPCPRHNDMVCDAVRRRLEALARGNVVRLREPADLPVLVVPLVSSVVYLGALSLAGVTH
jgi:hypothetical protein